MIMSLMHKLLYGLVILSTVLTPTLHPLTVQAAPGRVDPDAPSRTIQSDPLDFMHAYLPDDPQTQVINVALDGLYDSDWSEVIDAPSSGQPSPILESFDPAFPALPEPTRPQVPPLTLGIPDTADVSLPGPARPQVPAYTADMVEPFEPDDYARPDATDDETPTLYEDDLLVPRPDVQDARRGREGRQQDDQTAPLPISMNYDMTYSPVASHTRTYAVYLPMVAKQSVNNSGIVSPQKGGKLTSPGQNVTVTFRPDGLPDSIKATVLDDETTWLPGNFALLGPRVSVQAYWLADNQPVAGLDPEAQPIREPGDAKPTPPQTRYRASVSIRLTEGQEENSKLAVARLAWNSRKWELLPTQVDAKAGVAVAETDRLGVFALVENTALQQDNSFLADIGDEVIVDDSDPGFVTYEYDGSVDYFWDSDCGPGGCWNGDAVWTYNRSPFEDPLPPDQAWNWAEWTPALPEAGYYYVEAWIPADHATTTGAEYEVHHAGEVDSVTVNQLVLSGVWKPMGAYYFAADGSEYVYLDDVVPEQDEYPYGNWSYIGYDAIKFIYAGLEPPPPVDLEPPVIHSVDRWLDGCGSTTVRAHVTDNVGVGEVVLIFNGVSVNMAPVGGDMYEAAVPVPPAQISQLQVVAVDIFGNEATFPPGSQINIRGYLSRNLGWHNYACGGDQCNPGNTGTNADPVSTDPSSGNFTYRTVDLNVVGIGDTDIGIERGYNASPNEEQGTIRYTLDGDTLVEEPFDVHPDLFGFGWTFSLGPSLLVISNTLLQGVQVRYADGHTANFADDGDGTFSPVETRVYDQLTTESDGYLLERKDLTGYHFDADGRLTRITDRNDNVIDLTYEGDKLIRAENSAGRWVRFEYDGGLISDVYAPESVHLHYEYQDGRLTSFTNARIKTTSYEYDAEGRLTAIITPEGHPALRLDYDELGRAIGQIIGAGERHTFDYDVDNRMTTITDIYGNQTVHVYDEQYRLVESRNASGSEYYGYNDRDNRTYFKDQAGGEWHYTYNDRGSRLTQDGPLNWHNEFVYNDLDLVTNFIERVNVTTTRETTFGYDDRGNLTDICNPLDDCSAIIYDGRGLPTDLYDFADNHVHNTYDAEGDLTAVTNAEGETVRFDYDDLGRMIEMQTPLSYTYSYAYDPNDNLIAVHGPLGYHLGYSYDDNDNLEVETDPNSGDIHYGYDASENLTSVENQLRFTTVYTYGLMNELTSFQDAEGRVWRYEHDATLRMTDVYGPLNTHVHFDYDAMGNPTDVTDAEGHVTHTGYDALYRPVEVTLNYRPGEPESADTNVVTFFEYDLLGNVLRAVDPEGNPTVYQYDLMGQMTLERDAEEQEWEYGYDPMGNLALTINPRDFETIFGYDGAYRLQTITDTLGYVTTFLYDDDGNLSDETDPLGVVTHYEYDELDRLVREMRNYIPRVPEDAETNVTTEYEYDPAGNLRFVTDPRDYEAEFRYDDAHRLEDTFDYEDAHTHFAYDRVNNLLSVTDDNVHTTAYAYDELDRRATITNAEQHTITFYYDLVGNLTDLVDANDNPTHFDVDALGRVTRALDALDGEWFYEYDRVGNVLVETDANGHDTTYTYDEVYRLRTVTDAEGNLSEFIWDANGNLEEFIDGNLHPTTYTYDAMDRLVAVTNAETETTEYRYDPLGNQTHLIEADDTVTLYGSDPLYRLASVTENYVEGDPSNDDTNVVTSYVYDPSSNLAQIINANGHITTFEHDGMGRVVREIDPLDNTWEYTYDGVGNRLTRLDANGALTGYGYYPDDQLRRVDYPDGTFVEYAYDLNNNRTSMVDWLGTTTWQYDDLDRLTDVVDPFDRALHFEYDKVGNRTEMVYPDGNPVAYTYYDNDWLKTMVDPTGRVTFYGRDDVGNVTRIIYPNSVVTTITYDRADRVLTLVNQQTTGARKTNSAFAYTYNDVGHVTQVVNEYGWRNPSVVTETYSYDGLHRLAGMADSDGVLMSYTYDPVGNRLTWETNDDLTTQTPRDGFSASYDYNDANQLVTATIDSDKPNGDMTIQFAYDGNGNRVDKLEIPPHGPSYGTDYTYDHENRLVVAQDYQLVDHGNRIDRAITTLEYDGGGRRLVKTYDPKVDGGPSTSSGQSGQKRVEYVFDGLDPVAEYDVWNPQYENFYRGAMGRITTMHHFPAGSPGQLYWYHYNFKGDVVGLTKHHGQSTHNYRYDPYGGVIPDHGNFTDPHNHYTLTGKESDENTGLVYFGARHYDPVIALWATQDVYRGELGFPASLQRYQYVYNSPINYIDQYGFEGEGFFGKLLSPIRQLVEMEINKRVLDLPVTNAQRDEILARRQWMDTARTKRALEKAIERKQQTGNTCEIADLGERLYRVNQQLEQTYQRQMQAVVQQQVDTQSLQAASKMWYFIPAVGAGYAWANAYLGTNAFTGEELSTGQRLAQVGYGVVNVGATTLVIAPFANATYAATLTDGTKIIGLKIGLAGFDAHVHYGDFFIVKIVTRWFVKRFGINSDGSISY